jgi:fumarate reductase subunit D
MRRTREPFFWSLFAAGGTASALALPAIAFILWVAVPLGWVPAPAHETLARKLASPALRAALLVFLSLCAIHAAHRLRHLLQDTLPRGRQRRGLAAVTYGAALAFTLAAAWLLGPGAGPPPPPDARGDSSRAHARV